MSKPKPPRRSSQSRFKPSPDVPRESLLQPGDPDYWLSGEQYVGIRFTCRACGDNRRMGLLGLSTRPDDDEPWFEGVGVEPAGFNTSTVLHCREGHNVPLRHDKLVPLLQRWKEEVGPNGRRVESVAL